MLTQHVDFVVSIPMMLSMMNKTKDEHKCQKVFSSEGRH